MTDASKPPKSPSRRKPILIAVVVALVVGGVALEIMLTRPVRGAVRTYTQLIGAANRQDLDTIRALCTDRYKTTHVLKLASEGGMVGMPRNIHKNFQVWREGEEVWLCPTNRVGPVYRFVEDEGQWKFDGVVGQLVPGGQVEPLIDENELPDAP